MSDIKVKTKSLRPDTEEELKLMELSKLDFRKEYSQIYNNSKQEAKLATCFFCGKSCSSFCKSHSIPAFCLRNIAVEGLLYNNFKLVELPGLDDSKGIANSGTFYLICNDCDSKIFSEYENPENYNDKPTQKMLTQIVLKNYLKVLYKRLIDKELYKNIWGEVDKNDKARYSFISSLDIDLKEYLAGYNRAKSILNKKKHFTEDYQVLYFKKLDYVVPYAFQSNIIPIFDLEGNIINNLYIEKSVYNLKSIHICVFPFKDQSIVMIINESKDKRFREFRKQLNKLSDDDILAAINFMIFAYSEDIFLFKGLDTDVLTNKNLIELSNAPSYINSNSIDPFEHRSQFIEAARQTFSFNKMRDVPNLLLRQYKAY